MNIFGLLASFGGGAFAASIGALPAFIMTGVFAVAGAAAGMCGGSGAGFLTGTMAFGPFFGPYVSFAGGVAAHAYAKKKGYVENGAGIAQALGGLNKPDVLCVGGIFGVIGYLLFTLVYNPFLAGGLSPKFATDSGIIVFFSGVLVRLVFGGKMRTGDETLSKGDALNTVIAIGALYSLVVCAVYAFAVQTADPAALELIQANYHVLVFGMAGVGLIFAEFGQPFFGCHHIVIMSAEAVNMCYKTSGNLFMAVIAGIIVGICAALLCDFEGKMWNSGTDSHIDGPAFAIFIMTFVVNAIWG